MKHYETPEQKANAVAEKRLTQLNQNRESPVSAKGFPLYVENQEGTLSMEREDKEFELCFTHTETLEFFFLSNQEKYKDYSDTHNWYVYVNGHLKYVWQFPNTFVEDMERIQFLMHDLMKDEQ